VIATAAVFLGEGNPHQPKLAELRNDLIGKRFRPVQLLGDGRHLADGEFTHGATDQLMVGG
jgi:hypothetical protein